MSCQNLPGRSPPLPARPTAKHGFGRGVGETWQLNSVRLTVRSVLRCCNTSVSRPFWSISLKAASSRHFRRVNWNMERIHRVFVWGWVLAGWVVGLLSCWDCWAVAFGLLLLLGLLLGWTVGLLLSGCLSHPGGEQLPGGAGAAAAGGAQHPLRRPQTKAGGRAWAWRRPMLRRRVSLGGQRLSTETGKSFAEMASQNHVAFEGSCPRAKANRSQVTFWCFSRVTQFQSRQLKL